MVVPGGPDRGRRLLDGLILPDGPHEIRSSGEVDVKGQDVVVVQTKANRLGMYLLGQAFFSARLIESFSPRSIRTVAICIKGDAVLEPIARKYGVEVVIYAPS